MLKVQHKPIKISKLGFKRKEQKETEENPSLAHRTVRCVTGECPVPQGRSTPTLHLRVSGLPLRYNSPDCPVWHRTVRCGTGLSGVAPDCPVPPVDKAPTVVRAPNPNGWVTWWRTGQPTVPVWWRTELSGAPIASSLSNGYFGG